jgi:hypothetical protein
MDFKCIKKREKKLEIFSVSWFKKDFSVGRNCRISAFCIFKFYDQIFHLVLIFRNVRLKKFFMPCLIRVFPRHSDLKPQFKGVWASLLRFSWLRLGLARVLAPAGNIL